VKFVFLCSCSEPGHSGVGDYSRRLAEELLRKGHHVTVVGLCEQSVSGDVFVSECTESSSHMSPLSTFRVQSDTTWKNRMNALCSFLSRERPDIISLQYVPYAFQPRGLPFRLGKLLRGITPQGSRWHMMFHEICIGLGEDCTWKHRAIGWIQKRIAAGLVRNLRPIAVHSHAAPYIDILRNLGVDAKPLFLFSNIPTSAKQVIPDHLPLLRDKQSFVDFAFFGTVHPDWNANRVVELVTQIGKTRELSPRIIAIGRGGRFSATTWETFRNAGVDVIETGLIDDKSVAAYLSNCDIGLSGYPPDLIQKSSAAATMADHGLNILVPRAPMWADRYMTEVRAACPWMVTSISDFEKSNVLSNKNQLSAIAEKFLSDVERK
jgi:hypothetical protein